MAIKEIKGDKYDKDVKIFLLLRNLLLGREREKGERERKEEKEKKDEICVEKFCETYWATNVIINHCGQI